MRYKICLETEHAEVDNIFYSLAAAKRYYTEVLSRHMREGRRFSIAMYSGIVDYTGTFWHHRCIATFDYDGDASVWEAE